ncbi:MAG: peptidylprolyl isomerase [Proteobacteria bacterium]|nr:peptidylprolyl isomerase [Pseudomonadota bacterium]
MKGHAKKQYLTLVTILAFASTTLSVFSETKRPSETKVAVVSKSIITQEDLNLEMGRVQQRFVRVGRPLSDDQLSTIREEILEGLIGRELLYQESQKKGIEVEEKAIDEEKRKLKAGFSSEDKYKQSLRDRNISEAAIESHFRKAIAVQRFIEIEFAQKVTVSEAETRDYYDSHPDSFSQPERVRARHILIKVDPEADESEKTKARKRLEEIRERLKKGEDFGSLASKFSQGPSSTRGGDLGYFRRGQMVKPFEEAAFALNPGEVSDIVETKFGVHLIKVVDKKPPTTSAYKDIKENLGKYLKRQKVQKEVGQYVEKLRDEAAVEKFLKEKPN